MYQLIFFLCTCAILSACNSKAVIAPPLKAYEDHEVSDSLKKNYLLIIGNMRRHFPASAREQDRIAHAKFLSQDRRMIDWLLTFQHSTGKVLPGPLLGPYCSTIYFSIRDEFMALAAIDDFFNGHFDTDPGFWQGNRTCMNEQYQEVKDFLLAYPTADVKALRKAWIRFTGRGLSDRCMDWSPRYLPRRKRAYLDCFFGMKEFHHKQES